MIVFILGLIAAQILNIFIRFQKKGNAEYLHYGIYLSAFLFYLAVLHFEIIFPFWADNKMPVTIAEEIKRPCGILLYIFYNRFIISFLDLKAIYPSMYRIVYWFNVYLGISFVAEFAVQELFRNNIKVQDSLYGVFSLVVFAVSVYVIYRIWRFRTRLSAFILTGTVYLTIGIFLSNFMNYLMMLEKISPGEYYLYPLFLGLGIEIYFFNSGLNYKSVVLETDLVNTQRQLIEQMKEKEKILIASQGIRNEIARDLHDNLGSTLSSISVYAEVAKIHGENNEPENLNIVLEKISGSSVEMVSEMNDIVWAINPGNDNMGKIIQRMESFAKPLAAARNVHFELICDQSILSLTLAMEKRKNFFLIFKEAVNNAIKYAGASTLTATIHVQNGRLLLSVADDGIGFNPAEERAGIKLSLSGNGLRNMYDRAAELKGLLHIESQAGKGTVVALQLGL
ncbi:MAG: hypothetical protein IPL84_03250 [Chitinophagaceae bacterium]|nr:hypothetical protein [Chitinophagaceae bacterium]